MAKKSKIPISNLSVIRAIKSTLLFKVKCGQWKELAYYSQLPEIKRNLAELTEKGFLVSKGKKFILTEKGQMTTKLFNKLKTAHQTIFYSVVPPVEEKIKKSKKEE